MPADTPTILEELLGQVDDKTEAQIRRIVSAFGIDENDALFLLLLSNSSVQVLLEQAPNSFRQTFEHAHQKVLDSIEQYEQAARRGVERQVSESVKELMQKAGATKARVTLKSLIGAGAIALGLVGLGLLGGWSYARWQQSQIQMAPGEPRQLTLQEAEALDWATSNEGQYARQLLEWNEALLGGNCQQQVKDLGVTIQMGTRKAKSGFCLVWTQPPSEREFFSSE
ncbi:DUF6753 family protein [Almyronema epifaneia]|jgi:ParB-like chromosome segregation protein Spo0J|uniref:DUF6753 family protein n=1 Tax=Almyronema epifaneia S1 TaxID=2991925 RepID=A0ABW6IKX3_9CYAN